MAATSAMTGNCQPTTNGNLDGAAAVATIGQSRIGPERPEPEPGDLRRRHLHDGIFAPASLTLQPGAIVAHNQATNDGGGVYSTGANASLSIAPGVVFLANVPNDVS